VFAFLLEYGEVNLLMGTKLETLLIFVVEVFPKPELGIYLLEPEPVLFC